MSTSFRASRLVRHMLALPVVLSASVAALHAQSGAAGSVAQSGGEYNLQLPAHLDLPAFSSSSVSSADDGTPVAGNQMMAANTAEHFNFLDAQYGRRRYGRPRYRGANTNEDGSEKYIFYGGAGFTQPLGDTYHLLTPSYGIQVGGGRQFNKHFALPIQFDYDHFGFTKQNISGESYIYTGDANAADNGIDANSHIWSFTVDPTLTFYQREGLGAYVVGAVGFYHKVANLTAPQTELGYGAFGELEEFEVQGNFATYTSNAVGFNGGFGLTYKFSRFSNEKLYGEVRYVFIDNSQRYGYTVANVNTTTYNGYDAYPANSNRTTYLPVKFGIRF